MRISKRHNRCGWLVHTAVSQREAGIGREKKKDAVTATRARTALLDARMLPSCAALLL